MRLSVKPARREHGFTLVELVLVIVVTSVMAATLVVFVRPAMETYLAARARADLVDQTDTSLRLMARDVRLALPQSVRTPPASSTQCFELMPIGTSGRYRTGPDTANDSSPGCAPSDTCSAPLRPMQASTAFDVLSPLSTIPTAGDFVVVGNPGVSDVYSGTNRARITAVSTPGPIPAFGRHRITIDSTQFTAGDHAARFSVVPAAQQAVFYVCSGADGTLDASGNESAHVAMGAHMGADMSHLP